ncbi:MAG: J domain-containing protein [Myxococcota bacterium]
MGVPPHHLLGIAADASPEQVRRAYKRLARRLHPDRNPDPDAAAQFVAVKAARDAMLRRASMRRPVRPPPARTATPPPARTATPPPARTSETVRPPPSQVRPAPPIDLEPAPYRLTAGDLWRPALYLTAAIVLAVALWMFTTTMQRAASMLGPPPRPAPVEDAEPE